MADSIVRSVETVTHGRVLIRLPAAPREAVPLLVGFHGYAENAERHLEQLERVPGSERWMLACVQGSGWADVNYTTPGVPGVIYVTATVSGVATGAKFKETVMAQ